jgi:dTDP-4-amino-4,6-dideoxygalactose transaminase
LRQGLGAINGLRPIGRDPRVTRETIYMFTFLVDEAALGVSRNRFVRAIRAEGVPCGVGNEPVYRSPLFPLESTEYRKACELAGAPGNEATNIDCPVTERIFAHEMVAIPHECLLGDDRDLRDIVAAAGKVASGASELADAKLDSN